MNRFRLDDYPWDQVQRTQEFITRLFKGSAPDRPACLLHPTLADASPLPEPAGLTVRQREAWNAVQGLRRRPIGGDDFVPTLGTGAGTCAMATGLGAEESQQSGVYWVKPAITAPAQIDTFRKPPLTGGKLGGILDQTRAYAECVDERLPIRIMDFQSPFTTCEQLLGSELFFTMPYDEPDRLKALMDIVTDFSIEFLKAQLAAAGPRACPGIWPPIWFPREAGIQMSDDNLVNVSPEIYEEFVIPYNNRISQAFGGLFLHSCTITPNHLPVLKKLKGLTGVNCDLSSSVSITDLLNAFGDRAVVAPHCYINTGGKYSGFEDFVQSLLNAWAPGKRLFIYPCSVMYIPARSAEIRFDAAGPRTILEKLPAWRRDRGLARRV